MHHDTPLISTIVAGLVLAYIFGMIANRLRMPPLVGYLFAGILVGPYTPGFVADQALGAELAELGVILLMFGVGLHFSLKDLMSVRALAIPGAVVQMSVATALGAGLGLLLGWDLGASLLFGLALSVASTVVLLKALQDRRLIESEKGRIAVGWLIVEDLAMVLALVLIPAIASLNGTDTGVHDPFVSFVTRLMGVDIGIWGILGLTVVKVAAFVGFMLVVGRRIIPWGLHLTAHTGSRELFRLAVLAIALGVALGSAVLFGVSLALGAFFAGMILSESELSHRAANETLPLRDAFAVLFFVSVGMLFDPAIILSQPLAIIATVFIIVIGKSLAAFAIVLLFRRPAGTALTISASLAQIGEFSFILASMGVSLAIMPPEGQDLILAGALISIVLNPVVFWLGDLMRPAVEARFGGTRPAPAEPRSEPHEPTMAAKGPATTDIPTEAAVERGAHGPDDDTGEPVSATGHTVLVGYGQVGRIVADGLSQANQSVVVIEDSDQDVAAARAAGLEVVYGNAARQDVLKLANLGAARNLLVAISNAFEAGTVCESGRKLNPGISIIARAYSEEEEDFLRGLGATTVIRGEREIGKGILELVRGEALAQPAAPEPEEPRLPPGDNLLAQAAASLSTAAPVAMIAAETLEPAEPAILEAALGPAAPSPAPVEVVEEAQAVAEPVHPVDALSPVPDVAPIVVVEAVPVIELPPPAEPVSEPSVPAAELVPVDPVVPDEDETTTTSETPAAGDEVIVLPPVETAEAAEPTDAAEAAAAVEAIEAAEPAQPGLAENQPDGIEVLDPPGSGEGEDAPGPEAEAGIEPEATPETATPDDEAPSEDVQSEDAPAVPPVKPEPRT